MAGLRFDPAGMLGNLENLREKTLYAIETAGRVGAAQMEKHAKTSAPWRDHTGFARQTIQGKCERTDRGVRISLSSGVHYAVYLEYAMKKRWAILWPTIRKLGPEIIRQISRLG